MLDTAAVSAVRERVQQYVRSNDKIQESSGGQGAETRQQRIATN